METTILLKRGQSTNIPTLNEGEPGLVIDQKKLIIGSSSGNVDLTTAIIETDSVDKIASIGRTDKIYHIVSEGSTETSTHTETPVDLSTVTETVYYKTKTDSKTNGQYIDGEFFCYTEDSSKENYYKQLYVLPMLVDDITESEQTFIEICTESEAELVYEKGATMKSADLLFLYSPTVDKDKKYYFKVYDRCYGTDSWENNKIYLEGTSEAGITLDSSDYLSHLFFYTEPKLESTKIMDQITEDEIDDSGKCICWDYYNQTCYYIKKTSSTDLGYYTFDGTNTHSIFESLTTISGGTW